MSLDASTYQLETRSCLCGCGETFRVLPSSPSRYASQAHQGEAKSWREERDEALSIAVAKEQMEEEAHEQD